VIPLIPFPVRLEALPGGPLHLRRGVRPGRVDPALVPVVETVAADMAADGTDWYRPDGVDAAALDITLHEGGDPGDESYSLRLGEQGVVIESSTPVGVARALTTCRQLASAQPDVIGPFAISDSPRYRWRGLSLDVARTFYDLAQVKRVLDILALYKCNVLHLHLTDDQGWRLEIPSLPRLTEIGGQRAFGNHPGGAYSVDDFAEIVRYGSARCITVVPEIDMPGHAAAAIAAYPDLAESDGSGRQRPSNLLHPDHPGVMQFVSTVLSEVAAVSPGQYLHIGGDEAVGMPADAYRRFVERARDIVRSLGKTPVTWQEGASTDLVGGEVIQHWLAFDPAIEESLAAIASGDLKLPDGSPAPTELVVHLAESVRNARSQLLGAIERGASVLLSPAAGVYLDRPYLEHSVRPEQRPMRDRLGLSAYPRATVEDAFAWDPGAALAEVPDIGPAILGVEAAIWSETLATGAELEFMLLPRLAGIAERAWSKPPISHWDEYRERLAAQRVLWDRRGWAYFASDRVPWDG